MSSSASKCARGVLQCLVSKSSTEGSPLSQRLAVPYYSLGVVNICELLSYSELWTDYRIITYKLYGEEAKAQTTSGWRQPLCFMSGYGKSLRRVTVSPTSRPLSWEMYVCVCVCMCAHTCVFVCVSVCVREEKRERESKGEGGDTHL